MSVWCMHIESLRLKVWSTEQQQLPEFVRHVESRIPHQTQLQDLHLITILGDPHAWEVWESVLYEFPKKRFLRVSVSPVQPVQTTEQVFQLSYVHDNGSRNIGWQHRLSRDSQTFAVGSENFSCVNVFRVLVRLITAANSNYAELLRKDGLGEAGRIL